MPLNNEKLKELSFLGYLNYTREIIKNISYSKGSNAAYLEASEIINHILNRYKREMNLTEENYYQEESGNMFRINKEDLKDYSYKGSDKSRKSVINRFKEDMDMDLSHLIIEIQNEKQ